MGQSKVGLLKILLLFVLFGISRITFTFADQSRSLDSSAQPGILVVPDSLVDSMFTGETHTLSLTIHNTGDANLNWNLSLSKGTSDDLTGLRIMWARSHGQTTPTGYSVLITDLPTRGANVGEECRSLTPDVLNEYDILWSKDLLQAWTNSEKSNVEIWFRNGGRILIEIDDQIGRDNFNDLLWRLEATFQYYSMYPSSGFTTAIHPHETTIDVDSIYLDSSKAQIANIVDSSIILISYPTGYTNTIFHELENGRMVATADELFYNQGLFGVESDNLLFGNQNLFLSNF